MLHRMAQMPPDDTNHSNKMEANTSMITKVTVRPNAFATAITLDVSCDQSQHTIVRMFSEEGKIIKMFSWYLVKGTNITTIGDLNMPDEGVFHLDIIDTNAELLFKTHVKK